MAAGTLTLVADDIKTLITATVTASGGTAARGYVPLKDLTELSALTVTVVPRTEKRTRERRKFYSRDFAVDVAVQKKVNTDSESDALTLLVETLCNLIEDTPLSTQTPSILEVKVEGPDPGHLNNHSVFTTIITATYRGGRRPA